MDPIPLPEPAAAPPGRVAGDSVSTSGVVPPPLPGPPPLPLSPPPAESRAGSFYVIDSTRVSLREYWWGNKSPLILLAAALKAMRARIPSSADDPNVESLGPFEVDVAALPPDVQARFEPVLAELAALGFHSPIYHALWDPFHSTHTWLATLPHAFGRACARVHNRVWHVRHPPRAYLFCEFLTEFVDGSFLWSLASKPDMAAPPRCRINRLTGAMPGRLWASHEEQLARPGRDAGKAIVHAADADAARALLDRHHAVVRDFHLGRGVFRPMTDAERARAVALEQGRQEAAASGLEHAPVLAELDALQRKRTSWTSAILILVVSLGLFAAAGSKAWDWQFVALLIPVLLFHETGHYVAMKVFRYQNLRMFFIPFFGAAVSGQNFNAPGWKKAIVALAGPVPGIVLGAALGLAGIRFHNPTMRNVAVLALILNGMNLIPVLPLDGGRVAHVLFFARHHLLDVAFRAAAACALLAGGFLLGRDWPLILIGAFMLLGLRPAYRLARIVTDLRRGGFPPAAPGERTIPPPAAQAIIGRIKAAFPRGLPTRSIAQYTLNVYDTLNARPPGWLATLGFAGMHAGAFVAAVVFIAVVEFGGLPHGRRVHHGLAAMPPANDVGIATIARWDGPRARGQDTGTTRPQRHVVVATFPGSAEARRAFDDLTGRPPPADASVQLFGRSVILSLPPADRAEWVAELRRAGAGDVVAGPATAPPPFTLICVAPDEVTAGAIQIEADGYLRAPRTVRLLPPWLPDTGSALARPDRYSTREGTAARRGSVVTFGRMRLVDPADGAPALVQWLDAKGCRQIRYRFDPPPDRDVEMSPD